MRSFKVGDKLLFKGDIVEVVRIEYLDDWTDDFNPVPEFYHVTNIKTNITFRASESISLLKYGMKVRDWQLSGEY